MLKKYCYLIIILITGCSVNDYKSEGLPTNIPEKEVCGKTLDIGDYYLHRPLSMELSDSFIILLDYFDRDYSMQIFSKSGELISKFGKKGRGRGELTSPNSFVFNKDKKAISVFDPNLKKHTTYHNLPDADVVEAKLSRKSMSIPFRNCFKIGQYSLATGYFGDNRFAILDSAFNIVKYDLGYSAIKHFDEKEDIPYVYNYQPKYAIRPDGKKMIYGSYLGVIMEIYDLYNFPQTITLSHRKEYIYPKYEKRTGQNFQVWESDKCEIGFYDFYTTNSYIYALISGTTEDVAPNSIYVFDWDGKPVMKLKTDKNLCSIAIDEQRKELYGVNITMSDVDLVFFSLEGIL